MGLGFGVQVQVSSRPQRYHFVDGLRGLFSLIVLLFHVFFVFFVNWMPAYRGFGLLFDGDMAVRIFFVLSGFSLCVSYFRAIDAGDDRADGIIRKMAAARYVRLALPSLGACLIMYAIIKADMNYFAAIPEDFKQDWWSWAYRDHDVSLPETLRFSLYDVFLPGAFIPVVPYEGPYLITNLWTMSIEFIGSIIVFMYALTVGANRYRLFVSLLITVALVFVKSYFAFFFAGMVAADIFLRLKDWELPRWAEIGIIALVLCLFAIGRPKLFHFEVIASLALVLAVALGTYTRAFFSSAPFRYLGSISFALYLVHMPVIVSVQSYLYLTYASSMSQPGIIAVSGGASLVVSLMAAHLFAYIDRASIRFSHSVGRAVTAS